MVDDDGVGRGDDAAATTPGAAVQWALLVNKTDTATDVVCPFFDSDCAVVAAAAAAACCKCNCCCCCCSFICKFAKRCV